MNTKTSPSLPAPRTASARRVLLTALANVIGGDVTVNGATLVGSGGNLSGTGWDLYFPSS